MDYDKGRILFLEFYSFSEVLSNVDLACNSSMALKDHDRYILLYI